MYLSINVRRGGMGRLNVFVAAVHYTIMYNGCTASQYLKVDPLGRWIGAHFH